MAHVRTMPHSTGNGLFTNKKWISDKACNESRNNTRARAMTKLGPRIVYRIYKMNHHRLKTADKQRHAPS